MANFTYKRGIPAAANNPSNDQPNMRINTDSIDSLIAEDHVSFNTNNGGLHNQTRILAQASIPAGLAGGMGTLYTKNVSGQETTLFYTAGNTGKEWRLTRTRTSDIATFGTNTNYSNVANAANTGGWIFLPGGVIMFYGTTAKLSPGANSMTITFPFAFPSGVFSITATPNFASTQPIWISSTSTANFIVRINPDSFGIGSAVMWMAIGT